MDVACTIRCYAQTSAIVRVVPLNIAQAGADDIKKHKWFASDGNTYWEDMLAKNMESVDKQFAQWKKEGWFDWAIQRIAEVQAQ